MLSTPDAEKTACLCLDYDGCGEVLKYIGTENEAWAEPLIALITLRTEGYLHLILSVGSRRQSPRAEYFSNDYFSGNGYCSVLYSDPELHHKLQALINHKRAESGQSLLESIRFFPFMLGDFQNNLALGRCVDAVKYQTDGDISCSSDSHKRLLILQHLHMAKHYEPTVTRFIFIDDNYQILRQLNHFFSEDPFLIPAHTELYLAQYVFNHTRGESPPRCLKSKSNDLYSYHLAAGCGRLIPEDELRRVAAWVLKIESYISYKASERTQIDAYLNRYLSYLSLLFLTPDGYTPGDWDTQSFHLCAKEALWHLLYFRWDMAALSERPAAKDCVNLQKLLARLKDTHALSPSRYRFYEQTIYDLVADHAASEHAMALPSSTSAAPEAFDDTAPEARMMESPIEHEVKVKYFALFASLLGNIDLMLIFNPSRCWAESCFEASLLKKQIGRVNGEIIFHMVRPSVQIFKEQLQKCLTLLDQQKAIQGEELMQLKVALDTLECRCLQLRNLPSPFQQLADETIEKTLVSPYRYKGWQSWASDMPPEVRVLQQLKANFRIHTAAASPSSSVEASP